MTLSPAALEAVPPIMESIALGRTDIVKTLLDEVKRSNSQAGDWPENGTLQHHFTSSPYTVCTSFHSFSEVNFTIFLNFVHNEVGPFLHNAVKVGVN